MPKMEAIEIIRDMINKELNKTSAFSNERNVLQRLYYEAKQLALYAGDDNYGKGISCTCSNEKRTGTVSIDCCNICGKSQED